MGRIKIGNIKGPQGEAGKDFEYAKTYASVSAMNADYSGTDVEVGEYVIIDSGNNDADNGKVYRKGSNAYTYEHNIAGPTGPRGATGPMPTLYNGLDVTTPGLGALDAAVGPTIANKVSASGGEAGDTVASFTSADSTTDSDITAFTAMEKLTSGSALKTLMNIVSKAVKNIRWLKKKADAADTSISSLNDAIANFGVIVSNNQGGTDEDVSANTWKNVNAITLPAGTWLVYARFVSSGAESGLIGKRVVLGISNDTATPVDCETDGGETGRLNITISKIVVVTQNTAIYSKILHNGTSSITLLRTNTPGLSPASGRTSCLIAVRLK